MTEEEWKKACPVTLNDQQAAAVQATSGSVLLLAVPGSGKTTVLVLRLGYLLFCKQVPPENILTVTYTVAATRDMRERFASFFGEELADRLEFRTINGLSARIIRYYEKMGHRAFTLMTDEGKLSALLGDLCRKETGEFATESTIKSLRTIITYIKNQQLTVEEIENLKADDLPVGTLYRSYCTAMQQREWMDYDDQMVYAARILMRYPEILRHFQGKYRYLCVDEAQDTSKIQHTILRLLAGETPHLFLVGDEDQSIYGFRAADPLALLTFEKTYPGGQVLFLENNYRSKQTIVRAAAAFIQQNTNRRNKTMRATRKGGAAVQEIWVSDRTEQYLRLAKLAQACDRETAVLYRNNDSALPLVDLLDRRGTPYRARQIEGSFFTHRVVRDITDFIQFAENPADGDVFLRIYYKLHAGISKQAAQWAVKESGGSRAVLELLAETPGLPPWTQIQCKARGAQFQNMRAERADRAIYRIKHSMGYGDYLQERGADLGKLDILEALGRQEDTPLHLLERLEELREVVKAGSADTKSPVLLSTIHSSKGLEYERVILMDVVDGLLPCVEPPQGEHPKAAEVDAYEEERRIFYVGMTRAKEELSLFRFRKTELHSHFAEALFPPKSEPVQAKPKPVQSRVRRKEDSKPPVIVNAARYIPGVRVSHRIFGRGTLMSRQGDIATIHFDSGEQRRFSLGTALRQSQLNLS